MSIDNETTKLQASQDAALVPINGTLAEELSRLYIYQTDINDACNWLESAKKLQDSDHNKEAFYIAALIKYRTCFEGSLGLRKKPLPTKIFNQDDRKIHERLRKIRNKIVAHDDHLYPGEIPLIVINNNGLAMDAICFRVTVPFNAMKEAEGLGRLALLTKEWVDIECKKIAKKIVDEINAMPQEQRHQIRKQASQFTIKFTECEDRLK